MLFNYNSENCFQIRELVAEIYMFLNMVVRHTALSRKLALNVEEFHVKPFLSNDEP